MSREAMQLALIKSREKLEIYRQQSNGEYQGGMEHTALVGLIDAALEAELAKPEQEPVAWVDVKDAEDGPYNFFGIEKLPAGKHYLYTTTPQPSPNLSDKDVQASDPFEAFAEEFPVHAKTVHAALPCEIFDEAFVYWRVFQRGFWAGRLEICPDIEWRGLTEEGYKEMCNGNN